MHRFLSLKAHQLCINIMLCCGVSVCVPAQWQCVVSSAVWCVQCVLCSVECGLWCVQCVVWSWLTASAYSPVSPHRRWADQTLFWVEKILFKCKGALMLWCMRVNNKSQIEFHWHYRSDPLSLACHCTGSLKAFILYSNILYSLYSWRPMQWF